MTVDTYIGTAWPLARDRERQREREAYLVLAYLTRLSGELIIACSGRSDAPAIHHVQHAALTASEAAAAAGKMLVRDSRTSSLC